MGVRDRLRGDQPLQGVEVRLAALRHPCLRADALELRQGPDLDLEHFEGVEHRHRHCVGALIGQVASYAGAQPLVGLADIDRLAVVVEEGVDAPAVVPDRQGPMPRPRAGKAYRGTWSDWPAGRPSRTAAGDPVRIGLEEGSASDTADRRHAEACCTTPSRRMTVRRRVLPLRSAISKSTKLTSCGGRRRPCGTPPATRPRPAFAPPRSVLPVGIWAGKT